MKRKIPSFGTQIRDYTALISAFIYNLNVWGISAKNICSPGFNCHGCPWATFSCPVGVIGYGFGVRSIPAFAVASVVAVGIIIGRFACGYLCPFGLLQELLYRIKTPKFKLPGYVRYLKYIIMLLFVFLLTYLFGFEEKNAFIRISKPVLAKYGEVFDRNIFAAKNQDYLTEYFALPGITGAETSESADKHKDVVNPTASGIGIGRAFSNEGDDFFTDFMDEIDSADSVESTSDVSVDRVEESVFDQLQREEEEKFAGKEIMVEVTVENLSDKELAGFTLTPVFYDSETQQELWRGEDRKYDEVVKSGEVYTTEIFRVPYYLHKGSLVILSPQTVVRQDYWSLFCSYCPVGTLEADVPGAVGDTESAEQVLYIPSKLNLLRLFITLFILTGSIVVSRFFCRAFCPLGAMYGIFARLAVIRIVVEKEGCVDCGRCDEVCPVELDVRREAGGSECISCGNCIRSCPKHIIRRKTGL